ncbi:hypothetical protein AAFP35_00620 [Gordonia sp. CPCC 206044]|uniref:hypothetical protein n=1 Tax=Gordonia sp. CPCC 206044 TaxID=3140793 RepID=UPI003AF3FC02
MTIRRARFFVNPPDEPSSTPSTDDDLIDSSRRVAAWGGDAQRYLSSLDAGIRTAASLHVPVDRLDVAAVAAWRSGVPHIRTDAVGRLDRSIGEIPDRHAVFAAALGIEAADLEAFRTAQATDEYGWHPRLSVVAAIGGFRGVGGRFSSPPVALARAWGTHWFVRCESEHWQVRSDIFGATLAPCTPPEECTWSTRIMLSATVQAEVFPTSYLIWLQDRTAR